MKTPLSLKNTVLLYLCLIFLGFALWKEEQLLFPDNNTVVFFNLTEGEASLIKTKTGQNILINSGANDFLLEKITPSLSFFDKKIDLFVLSNQTEPQLASAIAILKRLKVKKILLANPIKNSPELLSFLKTAKSHNITLLFASETNDLKINNNLLLDIVQLDDPFITFRLLKQNNPLFLFSGNTKTKSEEKILLANKNISSKVFKAGFFGSNKVNSSLFLKSITPEKVIIITNQDGRGEFPHLETLERFKEVPVFITRDQGDVVFPF